MKRFQASSVHSKRVIGAVNVEEVVEHPLLDLLESVNSELDGFTLLELTDLYEEIVGIAYWWFPRNSLGMIEAIWVLQPQYVSIDQDERGKVKGYKYGVGNKKISLKVDDVLSFTFPNLNNPYLEGWSPTRAVYESVSLEEMGLSHSLATMENMARPDVIISASGDFGTLGEDESKILERKYRRKFSKGGNGGALIISDDINITPITFPPKDVQATVWQQLTKQNIANSFGVPMSLLQTKDVNRANAEAGHFQLAKNAILPRCRRLDQRLTQRFVSLFDPRLFVAFDNPVPQDKLFELQKREADLRQGVISINEAREQDGLEPIDNADVPFLPANLLPLGDEPPAPEPVVVPPPNEEPDESEKSACGCGHKHVATKIRGHSRRLPRGSALAKSLRQQFKRQEVAALKRFKAITKAWTPPPELFDDMNWKAFDEEMAAASAGHLAGYATQGVDDLKRKLIARFPGEYDTWTVPPAQIQRAMDEAAFRFSTETNATTRLKLNEAMAKMRQDLAAGIVSTETSAADLTARVKGVFQDAETWRAQRIAVTESNRAIHEGQRIAAIDSGVVIGFKWLLSADACPICLDIEASQPVVDMKSPFAVQSDGVYGIVMHPPAHPNCLLGETPVLAPGARKGFIGSYDGPIARIVFEGGIVSVTPNHMFLTPDGFASAATLREGDDVLYCPSSKGEVLGDPNDNGNPAMIKEVVTTLAESSGMTTGSVPVSSEYLHGDAAFIDGEIDIIAPDSLLGKDAKSEMTEPNSKIKLGATDSKLPGLSGLGNLASMLLRLRDASDGGVSIRGISPAFLGRESGVPDELGIAGSSDTDTSSDETAAHSRPRDPNTLANCEEAFSGKIRLTKILKVEFSHIKAPVYDIETESSLYIANGLVSSNCACTMTEIIA